MTSRVWVKGQVNASNTNKLLWGGASANLDRNATFANLAALTTQVMLSTALPLAKGTTVTNLTFLSGTTPAGTPTNWWFALYDPVGNKISQTVDQLTTAWAANTAMSKPLTTWTAVGGGVTNKSLTTNVVTLTTAAAHGLAVNDVVYVSIGDAVFDGTFTVTGVAASTFTYAKTNANVTSAAATGTVSKIVATPYAVPITGVYYAAIMVKATTVPTLTGVSLFNASVAGALASAPVAAQTSGSALVAVAPATIATPATVVNVPLVLAT